MTFTGSSGPGLFLQLLESSCGSGTFGPSLLLVVQKLFKWLTVVSQEELLQI